MIFLWYPKFLCKLADNKTHIAEVHSLETTKTALASVIVHCFYLMLHNAIKFEQQVFSPNMLTIVYTICPEVASSKIQLKQMFEIGMFRESLIFSLNLATAELALTQMVEV